MPDLNPEFEPPYIERLKLNHDWKFQDPRKGKPEPRGLLLSDEIQAFCDKGLLIKNWKPAQLRPASYTMTIGREYVDSKGKRGNSRPQEKKFLLYGA